MAKQIIQLGSTQDDGTGSTLRDGGDIINDNFTEIYSEIGDGTTLASASKTETLTNKTLTTEANTITSGGNAVTSLTAALQAVYPVGSIYTNATNATNPGTLFGFGTWTAFGTGRVPVGIDSSQTEFDTAEETGGAKTHTLTVNEMPSHTHETQVNSGNGVSTTGFQDGANPTARDVQTSSTGGGSAHNNMPPYIVVYMWKRTG